MSDSSGTTGTLDQTGEDILTDTVSDEALEAAAGTGKEADVGRRSIGLNSTIIYCC